MSDRPLCDLPHDEPRPLAHGLAVCGGHRNQLEGNIELLPALYEDLELRLRPTGPPLKPYTTGQGEQGPFVNGNVVNCRDQIVATLSGFCRVVSEDRGVTPPAGITPAETAGWLGRHVEWIAASSEHALEMIPWLDDLTRLAKALAYPSGRRRIVCSRCFEVTACDVDSHEEQRCEGQLTATVAHTDDLLPGVLECSVCGSSWTADKWLTLGRKIHREAS